MSHLHRARFPLLALALLTLILAAWGGLARMGWQLPLPRTAVIAHGILLVSGFVGTLIALERAVAIERTWAYLAPAFTATGALAFILGAPPFLAGLLMLLGSISVIAIFAEIIRRQPAIYTGLMGSGALLWAIGNTLWLAGRPVYEVVWWWGGYLTLTIAGERLEMSRLVRVSRQAHSTFLVTVGILLAGLLAISVGGWHDPGIRVAGVGLLAVAAWLLFNAGLLLRVLSDLAGWGEGRLLGGMLNFAALLLFVFNTLRSTRTERMG